MLRSRALPRVLRKGHTMELRQYEEMLSESPAGSLLKESYTVREFSKLVGRSYDWTLDQIKLHRLTNGRRGVRALPIGIPYQIPASELQRLLGRDSSRR